MKLKNTIAAPALIILIIAFLLVSRLVDPRADVDPTSAALTYVILNVIVFLIPGFVFSRWRENRKDGNLRVRWFSGRYLFLVFIASMTMIFGGLSLGIWLDHSFPESFASSSLTSLSFFTEDTSLEGVLRNIAAFALVPAVCEEYVFRSVILKEYEKFGLIHATLISALLFSFTHFSLVRFPIYFFGGVILAWVALASDSVLASMLVHFLYNVAILFLESYVTRCVNTAQNGSILLLFLVIMLALVSLFFLLASCQNVFRSKSIMEDAWPKESPISFASGFLQIASSSTFLVCMALYVAISLIIE